MFTVLEFNTHCTDSPKYCGPVEAVKNAAVQDINSRGQSFISDSIGTEGEFWIYVDDMICFSFFFPML